MLMSGALSFTNKSHEPRQADNIDRRLDRELALYAVRGKSSNLRHSRFCRTLPRCFIRTKP
jgi:hypothetical protein